MIYQFLCRRGSDFESSCGLTFSHAWICTFVTVYLKLLSQGDWPTESGLRTNGILEKFNDHFEENSNFLRGFEVVTANAAWLQAFPRPLTTER
jgi:hypothetical protein